MIAEILQADARKKGVSRFFFFFFGCQAKQVETDKIMGDSCTSSIPETTTEQEQLDADLDQRRCTKNKERNWQRVSIWMEGRSERGCERERPPGLRKVRIDVLSGSLTQCRKIRGKRRKRKMEEEMKKEEGEEEEFE